MNSIMKPVLIVPLLLILLGLSMSMFKIDQRQHAIMFEWGKVVKTDFTPGIHFKMPFMNKVIKFEKRILTLDAKPERFFTAEKKFVIVDYFVKWRITDVSKYYQAVTGREARALQRMARIINDSLKSEVANRKLHDVIAGERAEIMNVMQKRANEDAALFGVEIVDLRIKRVDLPEDNSNSIYKNMRAERLKEANDYRSNGAEAAERIRADADRQRTVIMANAYRDSEKLRGEGDAKASDMYANAYNRNPDFFSLYRSLSAYKRSFAEGDVMVLEPDSEFFKYFNQFTKSRK
ncbi:MAG: protease modulator HflC [Gammaproteobacteria bacterium]|nr:protease modulator HflC [Gammaproteobacteria bacterium]